MKILFIGDIVASPGRNALTAILPKLKKENVYDLVIANAENVTHGKGISEKHMNELMEAGIDFFTSGNHIWRYKKLKQRLDEADFPVIRPANYPQGVPGRGFHIIETGLMKRVLIINLIGRVFVPAHTDCPFRKADEILQMTAGENLDAIIVDFHAEATSEKVAFGHYLDGKVSAVLGTHTHIQTADERILPKGTAYITDVGMVGKKESVIGVDKENILKHFLTQLPVVHEFSEGPAVFNAVEIEIDPKTCMAKSVKAVRHEYNNE